MINSIVSLYYLEEDVQFLNVIGDHLDRFDCRVDELVNLKFRTGLLV